MHLIRVAKKKEKTSLKLPLKNLKQFKVDDFTGRIAHAFCVSEPNSNCYAKNHEHPVDLRYIDLAMYFLRGMNYLDSRKATEGLALVYDGECSADDCLASHH